MTISLKPAFGGLTACSNEIQEQILTYMRTSVGSVLLLWEGG
jgi:hypothetical protein